MKRIWRAFLYSLAGFKAAYHDEPAFREELWLAAVLVPLACFIAPDDMSLIVMIGSILLVLALELVNTAIEATVNHISMEHHPLAKKAKDTASAAVFIGLINVLFTWVVILL
ncbi:MAG: diacylglycerol kinase [Alphaproteobacteria bacterium]|nr:MAG: diacylglycerol kinase [Alphaproteobacteria bacterium]